jgi:hypothetical protein
MNFYVQLFLSLTVAIAAIIGVVRIKHIHRSYYPFICFLWLAVINEIASLILIRIFKTNAPNSNIYILLEFILLMWLFSKWSFEKRSRLIVLTISFMILWIVDNLIIHSLFEFNSAFTVAASFVILFLSINEINHLLFSEARNLFRNSRFIICLTFLIYFSYNATVEVFYIFKINFSDSFYHNLFLVLVFLNLFSNLMYAIATLWIPTKQKFSLPY